MGHLLNTLNKCLNYSYFPQMDWDVSTLLEWIMLLQGTKEEEDSLIKDEVNQ